MKTKNLSILPAAALAAALAAGPVRAQQLIAWPLGMPNPLGAIRPGLPILPLPPRPIPPRPLPPGPRPMPSPLPAPLPRPEDGLPLTLSGYRVSGDVTPGGAELAYDISFENPTDRRLEGVLLIPIPADTVLSGFTMTTGGKTLKGELLDAGQAATIYENIVRQLRDPGLLELVGERLVRARVFPIEPRGTVTVHLAASQALRASGGLYQLSVPMRSATGAGAVTRGARVRLTLTSPEALRTVYSPQAGVSVRRDGDRKAEVSYEADGAPGDLELFFSTARDPLAAGLLAHRLEGEDGAFLLSLTPRREADAKALAKDVVFVVDRSGSMDEDGKMDQAKAALAHCLKRLAPGDRFGVVDFATGVNQLEERLLPATQENVARALRYVQGLDASGGTNIEGALDAGLSLLPPGDARVPMLFLLTDGVPTVGATDVQGLLREAAQKNGALRARLFAFGVGDDVNTLLLDKLTEENRGARDYARPGEDIEGKVSTLYQKVARPALTDVRLDWGGLDVSQVTPRAGGDLFYGSELLVMGRYRKAGSGTLVVTGKSGGKTVRFEYPVRFPERAEGNAFLPRLWANMRVAEELDGIRLSGRADPEVVETITRLAKRYGIVTPYTSYLITEEGAALPQAVQLMRREADMLHVQAAASGFSGGAGVAAEARKASQFLGVTNMAMAAPAAGMAPGAAGAVSAVRGAFDAEAASALSDLKAKGESVVATREAGGKTFYRRGRTWVDGAVESDGAGLPRVSVRAMSAAYFALLAKAPALARWFALGGDVTVLYGGTVYQVVD